MKSGIGLRLTLSAPKGVWGSFARRGAISETLLAEFIETRDAFIVKSRSDTPWPNLGEARKFRTSSRSHLESAGDLGALVLLQP